MGTIDTVNIFSLHAACQMNPLVYLGIVSAIIGLSVLGSSLIHLAWRK